MDISNIKQLIELIKDTDINEIEYSVGDETIRIVRSSAVAAVKNSSDMAIKNAEAEYAAEENKNAEKSFIHINSPFVGTFYCAPSPGEKPFVEIGSEVKKGQTIGIVEAMKLMNAIEADADGIIKQILKKDGEPVEFGEPLFTIDPGFEG